MPSYKVEIPLLLHHGLVMQSSDFLPTLLSNSVHQRCSLYSRGHATKSPPTIDLAVSELRAT